MFLWSARTLVNALREHLPRTAPILEQIAKTFGTRKFTGAFRRLYPQCENISVDYAVLEPRSSKGEQKSNIFCLPAILAGTISDRGPRCTNISDEEQPSCGNLISGEGIFTLNARKFHSLAGKFVAAVGVSNLVVVETDDALLITTREHSQDVGKIVKHLDEKK